jgi:hypothetical protein
MMDVVVVIGPGQIEQAIARRVGVESTSFSRTSDERTPKPGGCARERRLRRQRRDRGCVVA